MGLIIPIINPGILPIQANRGRVSLATVHQVPAVHTVRAKASNTKTIAEVAMKIFPGVRP